MIKQYQRHVKDRHHYLNIPHTHKVPYKICD